METLLQDVRIGVRRLRKDRAFTALVLAVIALGVGSNTALYSLLNATLFRPLPIDRPEELVALFTTDARNPGRLPNSHLNIVDYRDRSSDFAGMTAYTVAPVRLQTAGGSDEATALLVSGDYFSVLGVRPVLGRTFVAEEDRAPGAHPVAVISYGLWQRRFGGDPAIAGKSLTINRLPFTIVGVAPQGFTGVTLNIADVWVPMMMYQAVPTGFDWYNSRRGLFLGAAARLKPGTDRRQAQANLDVLSRQLQQEHPAENDRRSTALVPLLDARLDPNGNRSVLAAVGLLYTVVAIVLLVGCANVANLLLVRGASRRREIATRLALGARRGRLVRQLLTESLVLALIAGAAGVLLAYWTVHAAAANVAMPIDRSYLLDGRVLIFALAVTLAAGLVFGLAPAVHASRPNVMGIIKGDDAPAGRAGRRLSMRQALFVAQVALSLVALVGSGLFIRSLQKAETVDPGFETRSILLAGFDLGREGYRETAGRLFEEQLLARAGGMSGVRSAALAQNPPFAGGLFRTVFLEGNAAGSSRDGVVVQTNIVGPGYFETLGIPLIAGRDVSADDRDGGPAAVVVNETMAKKFWPAEDPLGKHFRFFGDARPQQVVGIVRDTKYNSLMETPQPFIYRALTQNYTPSVTLHVRAARDPREIAGPLRAAVQELDNTLPLASVRTLRMQIDASLRPQRVAAALLALFGLLALALATIGIYGLTSYSVVQRTRELAIRAALGAEPRAIVRLVLVEGLRLAAIGVAIGITIAFLASRALAGLLFGVSPADPATFVTTSLVLATVAAAGCYLPARRGTKVNPIVALRS